MSVSDDGTLWDLRERVRRCEDALIAQRPLYLDVLGEQRLAPDQMRDEIRKVINCIDYLEMGRP